MSVSPKFVPRQHLLQYAIEAAEKGDMKEVNRLMEVRSRGYGAGRDLGVSPACSRQQLVREQQ